MPNHRLIVEILARIQREPRRWNQKDWITLPARLEHLFDTTPGPVVPPCKTAYCFAGHVAAHDKVKWIAPAIIKYPKSEVTNYVAFYAMDRLGLHSEQAWRLFNQDNTRRDLFRLCAEFLNIPERQLREEVKAKV